MLPSFPSHSVHWSMSLSLSSFVSWSDSSLLQRVGSWLGSSLVRWLAWSRCLVHRLRRRAHRHVRPSRLYLTCPSSRTPGTSSSTWPTTSGLRTLYVVRCWKGSQRSPKHAMMLALPSCSLVWMRDCFGGLRETSGNVGLCAPVVLSSGTRGVLC